MNPPDQYKSGICNIGEKEISVRKKFLLFFLPFVFLLTALCFSYSDSLLCWFALIAFTFAAIVLYLEIRYRFCILFGFFNLYNFGRLGNLSEVKCSDDRKRDRKRTLQIVVQALLVSVIYASVTHLLAMN